MFRNERAKSMCRLSRAIAANSLRRSLAAARRGSIGGIWRATEPRDHARVNYALSYSEVFKGRLGVALAPLEAAVTRLLTYVG